MCHLCPVKWDDLPWAPPIWKQPPPWEPDFIEKLRVAEVTGRYPPGPWPFQKPRQPTGGRPTMSGIVTKTCELMASLMRGAVHDRHTIAKFLGVTVAAGDRYIRAISAVPGVTTTKQHRANKGPGRLIVRFEFGEAMRQAGV